MRRGSCKRRPAATGTTFDPDLPRPLETEFLQCCHCGRYHAVQASIAALIQNPTALGYCGRCDGVHCPGCATCVPIERQLENVEAGRHRLDVSRVSIVIPGDVPG